MSLSKTAGLVE